MTALRDAANRRMKGQRQEDTVGLPVGGKERTGIEQLFSAERTRSAPTGNGMGFGPQFDEAMSKLNAGIDEPGPPPEVMRRIKSQRIKQNVQPDVAALGARYGVIPSGP